MRKLFKSRRSTVLTFVLGLLAVISLLIISDQLSRHFFYKECIERPSELCKNKFIRQAEIVQIATASSPEFVELIKKFSPEVIFAAVDSYSRLRFPKTTTDASKAFAFGHLLGSIEWCHKGEFINLKEYDTVTKEMCQTYVECTTNAFIAGNFKNFSSKPQVDNVLVTEMKKCHEALPPKK